MKRGNSYLVLLKHVRLVLVLMLLVVVLTFTASSQNETSLQSGRISYAVLTSNVATASWSGIVVQTTGGDLTPASTPFTSLTMSTPVIIEANFPGNNLIGENYWYAAMLPSTFSTSNLENVTASDLDDGGMFNSTHYAIFQPGYDSRNDNPRSTFGFTTENVQISGVNYSAYKIDLDVGGGVFDYYVLKYNDGGSPTPLFLTEVRSETCYNSSGCISEFLLPVNTNAYNFYALGMFAEYNYTVFIDGVETTSFTQTALPYNLTVEVHDALTNDPVPNVSVVVGEENGNDIFIPLELSGYVSESYSIGRTDANAREQWLVTPTVLNTNNYSIFLAVIQGQTLISKFNLTVLSDLNISLQSKNINPSDLSDNAKVAATAMTQISDSLFNWANDERGNSFTITHQLSNSTTTVYNEVTTTYDFTLKTGVPNVIDVEVLLGVVAQSGYSARVREQDGYLIVNPYTGSSPLSAKTRNHRGLIPTETGFVIVPTSLGLIGSNITVEILDNGGTIIDTVNATIDNTLSTNPTGASLGSLIDEDELKTSSTKVVQIMSSLFTALNT